MTRFTPVLRQAEEALDLPEPARSRVLGEMASDLEDLYEVYRRRGMEEEAAERRARALLGVSREVAGELRKLHEPLATRILRRYSRPGGAGVETALITILAAAAVLAGGATLVGAGLLSAPSPASLLVAAVGALGGVAAARSAVGLYLRPDVLGDPVERAAMPVFFLAGACGVVGIGTALVVLQAAPIPGAEGGGTAAAWAVVRDAAVTASLGLTLTLALALAGLHLHRRAREIAWAREGRPGIAGDEGAPAADAGSLHEPTSEHESKGVDP